jgi:hypothetical protein
MPILSSVRSGFLSKYGTTPPLTGSRAPSPAPEEGKPTKMDSISIEGNLYDVFKERISTTPGEHLSKEVRVEVRGKASFKLSRRVRAKAIKAIFQCTMIVVTGEGDGQCEEAIEEKEEISTISWTLWQGETLDVNRDYTFDFTGELPPFTPRSLRTPSGRIDHCLTVWLSGVVDQGRLRRTRKTVEIWNPFSMNPEEPRAGLDFHSDLELELVGEGVEIEEGLEAFVRYPDQCYKGTLLFFFRCSLPYIAL